MKYPPADNALKLPLDVETLPEKFSQLPYFIWRFCPDLVPRSDMEKIFISELDSCFTNLISFEFDCAYIGYVSTKKIFLRKLNEVDFKLYAGTYFQFKNIKSSDEFYWVISQIVVDVLITSLSYLNEGMPVFIKQKGEFIESTEDSKNTINEIVRGWVDSPKLLFATRFDDLLEILDGVYFSEKERVFHKMRTLPDDSLDNGLFVRNLIIEAAQGLNKRERIELQTLPPNSKRQTTYLQIIHTLAIELGIPINKPTTAETCVQAIAERLGISVRQGKGPISEVFKEVNRLPELGKNR